jgi:hypothetical protein
MQPNNSEILSIYNSNSLSCGHCGEQGEVHDHTSHSSLEMTLLVCKCGLAIHNKCKFDYEIKPTTIINKKDISVPPNCETWTCNSCYLLKSEKKPCMLCTSTNQYMYSYPSRKGGNWVHSLCASTMNCVVCEGKCSICSGSNMSLVILLACK